MLFKGISYPELSEGERIKEEEKERLYPSPHKLDPFLCLFLCFSFQNIKEGSFHANILSYDLFLQCLSKVWEITTAKVKLGFG